MHIPAVMKILVVFSAVLAGSRVGVPLGVALMAGGIGLDLWAGHTLARMGADLAYAVQTPLLWFFMGIIVFVVEIGRYLTEPRNANAVAGAIGRWGGRHGRAGSLIAVPSIIGLIPSPAGALISAPFVEQSASHTDRSQEWKTAVNYLFRHTWEYWWPLYPAVIVGISVFGIESWKYMLAQVPFTAMSLFAGYVLLVRPHLEEIADAPPAPAVDTRRVAFLAAVMGVVVSGAIFLPSAAARLSPGMSAEHARMVGMLAGLLCALGMIWWDERNLPNRPTFKAIVQRKALGFALTVAGVLVFKALLDRSDLLPVAGRELVASRIPSPVVVACVPLLAGLVTGIGVGYTGTAFPLVVGLMHTPGSGLTPVSTLVLASAAGYVGMMMSPVHLCLVMTRDFFSSSIRGVYRLVVLPLGIIFGFAVILHALFRWLGW